MNSPRKTPVFPYETVWEDFAPEIEIDSDYLESKPREFTRVFSFPDLPTLKFSQCDKGALERIAKQFLGHSPSDALVSRLHLVAGFHLTHQFRKTIRIDLQSQRPVLKRLGESAREFWRVANAVSAEVRVLLFRLHQVEPDTLVPNDQALHVSDVLCEAYDIALLAARVLEETRPRKTGRRPNFWRDTTVRLAASTIENETGTPIRTSRGNSHNPGPHFTNSGGTLLREYFRLLEARTDEAQIVQSLWRVRRRSGVHKNSRH